LMLMITRRRRPLSGHERARRGEGERRGMEG
jgi:hypothetical protein